MPINVNRSATVHGELDRLGKELAKKMKEYALPNKKTGALDKSIVYDTYTEGKERFKLEIYIMFYGKYLNAHTGFFNRAYTEVILDRGIRDIITYKAREIFDDVLNMDWGESSTVQTSKLTRMQSVKRSAPHIMKKAKSKKKSSIKSRRKRN